MCQKTDIAPDHVTVMRDLPVTTPARTVFDLAAELGVRRLARLVDWNVAQGLTSYETLQTLFERLARKGKPGTKRMRLVLEDRSGRAERSPSELEGLTFELIAGAGLPPPTREFRAPWLTPTNGRIDFAYEDKRLVIEADSRRWHAMADAFLTDRERDNRAQLAGWRVLRFTWWDVEQRPEYVVLSIRQALDLAQT